MHLSALPHDALTAYEWVDSWIGGHINWYRRNKKIRQRFSVTIRATSVILFIIGSSCPLFSAALNIDLKSWGFVALGLGASLFLVDKAFGLTNAWIRLMTTALKLEALQSEWRIEWASVIANGGDWKSLASSNLTLANQVIAAETNEWVQEAREVVDALSQPKLPPSP